MQNPRTYNLIPPIASEDFTELILSGDMKIDAPDPAPPVSLKYMQHLKDLKKFVLQGLNVRDLSPIHDFADLEILTLNFTKVENLEPLRNLVQLRQLEFEHTPVASLEPIVNLANLEQLRFICTPVDDLSPIKDLPALKSLWFAGTKITDLSAAAGKDLIELSFANTQVADLRPIATLSRLSELYFSVPSGLDVDRLGAILHALKDENDGIAIIIDGKEYDGSSVGTNNIIEIKNPKEKPIHGLSEFSIL